jgi:transposase
MDNATASATHQHRHDSDGYRRIELITGSVRRRRWTAEEKATIIAESLQSKVNISELARRRGVNRGLLQTWRREAMRGAGGDAMPFVPLRVAEQSPPSLLDEAVPIPSRAPVTAGCTRGHGTIEIDGAGLRIRISGPLDVSALHAVLAHVRRRP